MKPLITILLTIIAMVIARASGAEIRLDIAVITAVICGFGLWAFYLWSNGK